MKEEEKEVSTRALEALLPAVKEHELREGIPCLGENAGTYELRKGGDCSGEVLAQHPLASHAVGACRAASHSMHPCTGRGGWAVTLGSSMPPHSFNVPHP